MLFTSLVAAIVIETRWLLWLLRRKAHLERSVSVARSAVQDVIEQHFVQWGLTPAEADVANFLVKGMSISEIATLRGGAEGTVKSHLNGIYRKSGTAGRGELMALILDGLIGVQDPQRAA
jgi:DNA-binding CsgD family transcriptional regulator